MEDDMEIKKSGKALSFTVKKGGNGIKKVPAEKPEEKSHNMDTHNLNNDTITHKTLKELLRERDQRTRDAKKRLKEQRQKYNNRPEFQSRFLAVNELFMPHTTVVQQVSPGVFTHGRTEGVTLTVTTDIDEREILAVDIKDMSIEIPIADIKKLFGGMGAVKEKLEGLKHLTNDDGNAIIQGTEDAIFGNKPHDKKGND